MPARQSKPSPDAAAGYPSPEISDGERLYDLTRGELVASPSASVRQFWVRIRELQEEGKSRGLTEDITLLLINRGYASDDRAVSYMIWGTIPWGEFGRVKEFVRNNAARAYQIIWGANAISADADEGRRLQQTVDRIGQSPRAIRIPEAFQ